MPNAKVCRKETARVKHALPPDVLSQQQMEQLVRVFVQGKTAIFEDDLVCFIEWARAVRCNVLLLEMILAGDLRPIVDQGVVKVERPVSTGRRTQ